MTSRRRRILLLTTLALTAAWLVASAFVAWRLTRRPAPRSVAELPTKLAIDVESLSLQTSDGEELGAWFVPCERATAAAIVLHGYGESRRASRPEIELLHRRGLYVLAITLRGHGDSSGATLDFGYSSRLDVLAAIDWMADRSPDLPIYLVGRSYGAASILYAAPDLDSRVAGLLLEQPYRDLQAATWHRLEARLWPGFDVLAYEGLRLWSGAFLDVPTATLAPIDFAGRLPADLPVVVIVGGNDRRAPPRETRELAENTPRLVEFVEFPGAGHVSLLKADPTRYEAALDRLLSVPPQQVGLPSARN